MKFATRRVTLPVDQFGTTNTGEELWVELPVTVKERFATELRRIEDDPVSRKANAKILSLVSAWNLDDEEGRPLPLIRGLDPAKPKEWEKIEAIVGEVPLPLFTFISVTVTRNELSEGVLGNSRA